GVTGMALANYTYYVALQRIPIATAVLLIYTSPLLVLAADVVLYRQPLHRRDLVSAIVTLSGAALVVRAYAPSALAGNLGAHTARDRPRHRFPLLQPVGPAAPAAAVALDGDDLHAGGGRARLAAAGVAVDRPARAAAGVHVDRPGDHRGARDADAVRALPGRP